MSEFSHLNPKYDLYLNPTMSFFWLNLSKLRAFDLNNGLKVSKLYFESPIRSLSRAKLERHCLKRKASDQAAALNDLGVRKCG